MIGDKDKDNNKDNKEVKKEEDNFQVERTKEFFTELIMEQNEQK